MLDVGCTIFSIHSLTTGCRFSVESRLKLLPEDSCFVQNAGKWDRHHTCALRAPYVGAPSSSKIVLDMSGKSLTRLRIPFLCRQAIANVVVLLIIFSTYNEAKKSYSGAWHACLIAPGSLSRPSPRSSLDAGRSQWEGLQGTDGAKLGNFASWVDGRA